MENKNLVAKKAKHLLSVDVNLAESKTAAPSPKDDPTRRQSAGTNKHSSNTPKGAHHNKMSGTSKGVATPKGCGTPKSGTPKGSGSPHPKTSNHVKQTSFRLQSPSNSKKHVVDEVHVVDEFRGFAFGCRYGTCFSHQLVFCRFHAFS